MPAIYVLIATIPLDNKYLKLVKLLKEKKRVQLLCDTIST